MEDVQQPGSTTNPRGYFFEIHPQLLAAEIARRPSHEQAVAAASSAGLLPGPPVTLWETRMHYATRDDYLAELQQRIGRSILHELDDTQLAQLVHGLAERLPVGQFMETDRWTLWPARRPLGITRRSGG